MPERWQPTRDQHAWLMPHLTKFDLLPVPTPNAYRVKLKEEWLQVWPEQDVLWPDREADTELTADEKKELCSAEQARGEVGHTYFVV
jgi:hypothetical protein